MTSPAGDQPPAGARAALEIVIGEVATAYTASALRVGAQRGGGLGDRRRRRGRLLGHADAAPATDGGDERRARALLGVQQHERARADGDGGVGHGERRARGDRARGAEARRRAARVAARTVLFSAQAATAVPSDSSAMRGRSALPFATAGATRTGVQTPPAACAEAGASASRADRDQEPRAYASPQSSHGLSRILGRLARSCVASARGT